MTTLQARSDKTQSSLICFGTGDGCPCADRNHAAFLYRLGDVSILVDSGESIERSYKASGFGYDLIDAVFISHLHADHFGGLFMLLQGFWVEGRRKDLSVYLPGGGIRPLRQMLRAAFLFDEALPFRIRLKGIEAGGLIAVGQTLVTTFPTSHLDAARAQFGKKYRVDFDSYCFLLEFAGHRIGHSGDLGKPQDLEPLVKQPLNLLVCELAHFAPAEIFDFLAGRHIEHVVWVHVGRPHRQNLARIRSLAVKRLPATKHTFATDGQRFIF